MNSAKLFPTGGRCSGTAFWIRRILGLYSWIPLLKTLRLIENGLIAISTSERSFTRYYCHKDSQETKHFHERLKRKQDRLENAIWRCDEASWIDPEHHHPIFSLSGLYVASLTDGAFLRFCARASRQYTTSWFCAGGSEDRSARLGNRFGLGGTRFGCGLGFAVEGAVAGLGLAAGRNT